MSKACIRHIPRNGKLSLKIMSLHCHSAVAEKRCILINAPLAVRTPMVQEDVDMVAGDFNGWRHKSAPVQLVDSSLERLSETPGSLHRSALHPIGAPAEFKTSGLMSVALSGRVISYENTVHIEINLEKLGLFLKDQTRHNESWIHFSHVSTPTVVRERKVYQSRQGGSKRRSNISQR